MRKTFLTLVSDMIKNESDTVFFTIDMGTWAIGDLLVDYPDRAINLGIFEDGLVSVSAGIASQGLIPTIYGGWSFLIERAYEQIKLDFAYQKLGGNFVGAGASYEYSKYGYSHYCPEDIGLLKMLPGVEIVVPGNKEEFKKLFNQSYRNGNPTFFKLVDHTNKYDADVEFGKATIIKEGKKATVIVVSTMLDIVMDACKDEDVTVLYYTTLSPFDKDTLSKYYSDGKILICEPSFSGSLLQDVYETFPNCQLKINQVGFPREIYRNYGEYEDILAYYGLTTKNIAFKLKELY